MSQTPYEARQAEALASIEAIAEEVRLLASIERKAREGEALTLEEVAHLFRLETPAHERQTSGYDWDFAEEYPQQYEREQRKGKLRSELLAQSTEVLREQYGADADWLLLPYDQLQELLPGIIATKEDVSALLPYIADKELLELLDSYVEKLTPESRKYIADRLNYNLLHTESGKAFIRRYVAELKETELGEWTIVDAFPFGETLMEDIATLRTAGIADFHIAQNFTQADVESSFDALIAAGFAASTLASDCSPEFVAANVDKIYALDSSIIETYEKKGETQDELFERIVAIQKKGGLVEAQLKKLASTNLFFNHDMFTRLVAEADVSADTIFDVLGSMDKDGMYILHYANWLVAKGVAQQTILDFFPPYVIVDHRERFRNAGIEVTVSRYIRELNPEWVILTWERLKEEDLGMTIDEIVAQVVDTIDRREANRIVLAALEAGADAEKLLEKVADGTISSAYIYQRFLSAGLTREKLWPKLTSTLQHGLALGAVAVSVKEAEPDAHVLLGSLKEVDILENLEEICAVEGGAEKIVPYLSKHSQEEHFEYLIAHGAPAKEVMVRLRPYVVQKDVSFFLDQGVTAQDVFAHIKGEYIGTDVIVLLVEKGLSADTVLTGINTSQAQNSFEFLLERVSDKVALVILCMQKPSSNFTEKNYRALIENGASVEAVLEGISASYFDTHVEELMILGATSAMILRKMKAVYPDRTPEWYLSMIQHKTGVVTS